MTSRSCSRVGAVTLLLAALAASAAAQFRGFQAASVEPTPAIELKPGEETTVALRIRVRRGYHINSDTPSEDYMIPTQLRWESAPLEVQSVEYPAGEFVQYEFSDKPLSVYSNTVVIKTRFKAPASLPKDLREIKGKLRYQACNDKMCLAPTSLDAVVPLAPVG